MLTVLVLVQSISALASLAEFRVDQEIATQESSSSANLSNKTKSDPNIMLFKCFKNNLLCKHAEYYFIDYNFISRIFNLSINPSNYSKLDHLAKNQALIYDQTKRKAPLSNSDADTFNIQHAKNLFDFIFDNFYSTSQKMTESNVAFLHRFLGIYADFCKMLSEDKLVDEHSGHFPFNEVFRDLMYGLTHIDSNFSLSPIKNIISSCVDLYTDFQLSCETLLVQIEYNDTKIKDNFYQNLGFETLNKVSEKFRNLFIDFEDLVSNVNREDPTILRKQSLVVYYVFNKLLTLMAMVNLLTSFRFSTQANKTIILVDPAFFKCLSSAIIHLTCYASKYDNYMAKMVSLGPLAIRAVSKFTENSYLNPLATKLELDKNFDPTKKLDLKLLNTGLRDEFIKKHFKQHYSHAIETIFQDTPLYVVSRFNLAVSFLKLFFYEGSQNPSFRTSMKAFADDSIDKLRYREFYTFKALSASFLESIIGKNTPSSSQIPFYYIMLYLRVSKLLQSLGMKDLNEVFSSSNFPTLFPPKSASITKSKSVSITKPEGTFGMFLADGSAYIYIFGLGVCISFLLSYKIFKILSMKKVLDNA